MPPLEAGAVHESFINASLWDTRARTVGASEIIAEIRDVSEDRGDVPTTFTDAIAKL